MYGEENDIVSILEYPRMQFQIANLSMGHPSVNFETLCRAGGSTCT